MLEVRNLRKSYGRNLALDGVSFRVGPGEMFASVYDSPHVPGDALVAFAWQCLLGLVAGNVIN